ncbi:MAG: xanthine dehydrogenase family protein molybdopterin-binding subunit [Dehalococcoidia bacterium]|nr:xanthine dehydrogenase family protein molybdopterin-binding subunit [Dehalococcoidia bacterium]
MTQQYIGAPITRVEDFRFLTGQGKYLDDIKLTGMLHAAILRSNHGHALIKSIDTTAALALPGVEGVFTYDDIASIAKVIPVRVFEIPGLDQYLQVPLAEQKVRYVGEPVAMVVAINRYVAEDALELIAVDYDPLPAVTDLREALKDEVLLHEETGTNLAGSYELDTGDIEEAFRNAEYVRKEEFRTHRHTGNPLETRGLLADFDKESGELTVWGPTKVPHFNRAILANHLEIPEENIHFIEPDVGGGFGIRGEFYPEDFLIPFASMQLGHPVKWSEDRMEHLISANHSREVVCEVELAAQKDGTILGMRANIYGDMGAYVRTHGCVVPALTAGMLTGPYRIPSYHADFNCVMTNKTGTGTYRAPGFYEACFIRERLLDMAAEDLGLDPAEFRRINLIQASEMPYTVGVTRIDGRMTVYDSGDYPSAFNRALEEIGYESIKGSSGPDEHGRYHGVGVASYVEPTGFGPYEGARIAATKDGLVEVYLGITTLGQGHETVMAQICADSLGVPMEQVRIFHGNTDYLPASIGTFGSRATVMAGSAIHLASQSLQAKMLSIAAGYMDTETTSLEFSNGRVTRKAAGESADELDVAQIVALAESGAEVDGDETPVEATEYFKVEEWTYAYGSHVAHVAVDPETGKLDVLRYVVVEDVGRCINPLTMHGQSVGGAVQGIGGTVLEELVYDESGQLVSGSFMDYLLPTSQDVPNIDSIILEEAPSPLNPLGVKGAGEGANLATGAALANAVADALSDFGVHITHLPLSPNNIRSWIRRSSGA